MRIDNLSEGMSILQQIVNNPERKKQLVEFVFDGLTDVLKGVITKFELGNPTSVKSQETVTRTQHQDLDNNQCSSTLEDTKSTQQNLNRSTRS